MWRSCDDVLHLHLLSVMESRQAVHGGRGVGCECVEDECVGGRS